MSIPVFAYRHDAQSFCPARMTAQEIWRLGSEARRQLCRHSDHPRIDVAELAAKSRRLIVNGLPFETHWELESVVRDDEGHAAFGSVQHEDGNSTVIIALNAALIGDRDELWCSTAAHELGHAIFDVPGWIKTSSALPKRILMRQTQIGKPLPGRVVDWVEWRATEFMGALLAPRRLLARHLQRKAAELGLPLTMRHSSGTPVLNADASGHDGVEAIVLELAELFGLSPSFIHVRLNKYRLLHSL